MPDQKKIGPKPPVRPAVPSRPPARPAAPPPKAPPFKPQPVQPPRPPVTKTPPVQPARPPAAKPQPVQPAKAPYRGATTPPPVKPVAPGLKGPLKPAAERLEEKTLRQQQRRAYLTAGAAVAGTAVAGTAVGVAAATAGAPEELDALAQKMAALQQAAALVDIYDDLEDTDSALAVLPANLSALRSRGYVFASYLEHKIEVLAGQWAETRARVIDEVQRRSQMLEQDVYNAQNALERAYSGGPAAIGQARTAIQTLESKVSANQNALEAMFDATDQNVTQTQQQMESIVWALEQSDQAGFSFYPDEKIVAACRAQLLDGKDEPQGVLFLTDGRLIFERKEEVATKKVLFITTAKETVQELVFELPIGHIEDVKASASGGLLSRQEKLELRFSREAMLSGAELRLRGADNEQWSGLIGRVRSGEIDRERVQPAAEAEAAATPEAAAQAAPTKCPNCGGLLTTPIVRGMREITCVYCGTVIRL